MLCSIVDALKATGGALRLIVMRAVASFSCESSRPCQYMVEHPCIAIIVVRVSSQLSETSILFTVKVSPIRKAYK